MQRRHFLAALPCLPAAVHAAEAPLQVVASFSILADLVREVAGDAASVHALVGANADAHVFEPTPADARRLARADLVVVNGLGFEGWLERLVTASGYRGPVCVASQGIVPRRAGPVPDPHAWQSLAHAERYVDTLRAALATARPAWAGHFAERATAYRQRLQALDHHAHARFDTLPPEQRRVISSHDAFGYLGEAYGIRFIAALGGSTDAQSSASQLANLVRQVRAMQARALFVENISDRRLVERIAHDSGAVLGGTLYSDALSAPGTAADSYLRLYRHNVDTIADALHAAVAAEATH